MGEGIGNLLIQLLAVGDNDHTGVNRRQFLENVLGNHNHGQTFATALGMPYDATLAVSVDISGRNGADDFTDGKILLITADFFRATVKEDEIGNQLHHPTGMEQGNQGFILFSGATVGNVGVQRRL